MATSNALNDLYRAIEHDDVAAVQTIASSLTEGQLDVLIGKKELAPLHLCAIKARPRCTKVLIDVGANPNVRDEYNVEPLHYAASVGAVDVMEILIENKANLSSIDNLRRSPLECAVRYNRIQAVRLLLENHVNANTKNKNGATPLHQAADAGNFELVKILLEFKAEVNTVTEYRRTPLHYAAFKGHDQIASVLLQSNAEVNAIETKGRETPLHRAAAGGRSATIELLLKYKGDLHSLDQLRHTPLHKACIAGNTDTVSSLIASGSATGLKDKEGLTARERVANTSTRLAFDTALKNKKSNTIRVGSSSKIDSSSVKGFSTESEYSGVSIQDITRENNKDVLHLSSVLKAITKASEDSSKVIENLTKRHAELKQRERQSKTKNIEISHAKEFIETELKKLHKTFTDISLTIATSQESMERCIFQRSSLRSSLDIDFDGDFGYEEDLRSVHDKLMDDDEDDLDMTDDFNSAPPTPTSTTTTTTSSAAIPTFPVLPATSTSSVGSTSEESVSGKEEKRTIQKRLSVSMGLVKSSKKEKQSIVASSSTVLPSSASSTGSSSVVSSEEESTTHKKDSKSRKSMMRRTKSAKKFQLKQEKKAEALRSLDDNDQDIKKELDQLSKEQLIELAMQLQTDEEASSDTVPLSPSSSATTTTTTTTEPTVVQHEVTIHEEKSTIHLPSSSNNSNTTNDSGSSASPGRTPPAETGGMDKRLKTRIPSKTRLRISPLS